MMKFYKKAFSLIEILLVLAIVAIVVVMGISLTRKTTENAYNRYIYPGYINLQNAIADACDNSLSIADDDNGNNLNFDFVRHINSLFSGAPIVDNGQDPIEIVTKNGIEYHFFRNVQSISNEVLQNNVSEDGTFNFYTIKIVFPASQGERFMYVAYLPDFSGGTLIPTSTSIYNGQASGVWPENGGIQNRADLLPFYIDDGTVGRNVANSNDIGQYQKVFDYTDARTAYCRVYSNFTINNNNIFGNNACPAVVDDDRPIGIIRVADPYKVF